MKKSFIIIFLGIGVCSFTKASAQSATFNADSTVTYQRSKFKKGQEVQLFYGSGANKDFKFLEIVNFDNTHHFSSVPATSSKQKFVIDYVFLKEGKCTIRGVANWTGEKGDIVVVDVEGAIDNKEIVAPNNLTPTTSKVTTKKHQ